MPLNSSRSSNDPPSSRDHLLRALSTLGTSLPPPVNCGRFLRVPFQRKARENMPLTTPNSVRVCIRTHVACLAEEKRGKKTCTTHTYFYVETTYIHTVIRRTYIQHAPLTTHSLARNLVYIYMHIHHEQKSAQQKTQRFAHTPPPISEVPLRLVRAPHLALVGLVVVAVGVGLPALPAGRPCGVTAALWVSVFGFRFSVSACRTKNTDHGMKATKQRAGYEKEEGGRRSRTRRGGWSGEN